MKSVFRAFALAGRPPHFQNHKLPFVLKRFRKGRKPTDIGPFGDSTSQRCGAWRGKSELKGLLIQGERHLVTASAFNLALDSRRPVARTLRFRRPLMLWHLDLD
jgi:hypothetical protein